MDDIIEDRNLYLLNFIKEEFPYDIEKTIRLMLKYSSRNLLSNFNLLSVLDQSKIFSTEFLWSSVYIIFGLNTIPDFKRIHNKWNYYVKYRVLGAKIMFSKDFETPEKFLNYCQNNKKLKICFE
jgi:hypothetical protein